MSSIALSCQHDEEAYDIIQAAVMETSRGRWFLNEYSKRNRHAETMPILQALDKLAQKTDSLFAKSQEVKLSENSVPVVDKEISISIEKMLQTINKARSCELFANMGEGQSIHDMDLLKNLGRMEDLAANYKLATASILDSTIRIGESALNLQEKNYNSNECNLISACISEIYAACDFQNLIRQRIEEVVSAVCILEKQIKSLNGIEKTVCEEKPEEETSNIIEKKAEGSKIGNLSISFTVPAAKKEEPVKEAIIIQAELQNKEQSANEAEFSSIEDLIPSPFAVKFSVRGPAPTPYDDLSTEEKIRAFR